MRGILEIVQVDKEAEPSFEVWLRRTILAPVSGTETFTLQQVRDQLTSAGSGPPPAHWPIPADSKSNLAQALPWYLEQFVHQPTSMGIQRAQYVEQALHDWGKDVFSNLFTTDKVRDVYDALADSSLSQRNRIEIHSDKPQVLAWPWEVLFDHNDCPLGRMMVVERRYDIALQGPDTSVTHDPMKGLDILLVTARQGQNDVNYRLVSRPLAATLIPLRLTMLRPPTLENVRKMTHSPDHHWDVLHFDCHGWWGSLDGGAPQGHLLLEDDSAKPRPVSVKQLIDTLGDCCPNHVVINACRSAMTNEQTDSPFASFATGLLHHPNVHDVTAMAYNLQVDAAEPFLMGFYDSLNSGENVCTAVENGRFQMLRKPTRTCVGGSVKIQDWFVPVVYRRAGGGAEADLGGATVLHGPSDSDRINQPYWNERYVGRSGEMFTLDRVAERDFSLLLIHGLAGQGKTTLLREFLWWRARIGDSRGSIWIDFERMRSARDVLWHMAQALPDPPDQTIDIGLEHHLARALAANPSWIVWDHLHAARHEREGWPTNDFSDEDRTRLAAWLGQLAGTQSAVLAASRGPESWLLAASGCGALPLGGLKDQDRWQLVNQLLGNAEPDNQDATAPSYDGLDRLVSYVAGHPLITIDAVARIRQGQSAQVIHDALRTDLSQLRPWQMEEADASRLEQSLSCLDDTIAQPVLAVLSLHEEMIDESVLKQMMRQIHGDEADHMVDLVFARLETAGLLHNRMFLHPAVGGALRCRAELAPSDDVRWVFVDTIADRLTHPVESSHPPTFTIGTLHSGMVIAAGHKRTDVAMAIGRYIVQLWIDRQDFERAIRAAQELVAMCESNPDDENVIRTLLLAAQTTRMARNVDQSERWLRQAENRADHAHKELTHTVRAELHYQRSKLAELCGDIDTYRDSILRARQHADQSSDEQLTGLIAYELAQLRIRAGDASGAVEHSESMLSDLAPLHMQAGAFRIQAQAQLAEGNHNEARLLLQRAIALDTQIGNTIGKAMSISLLGEVEGRAKNLQAAIAAFEDAIDLFEAAGDHRSAAITYHQWAKTYYLNDLMEEAGEYFIHSARILAEVDDQATLVTVARNFQYYLDALPAKFASYMAFKWVVEKLPASEAISTLAVNLFGYPAEETRSVPVTDEMIRLIKEAKSSLEYELERTDHDDSASFPN